LIEYTPIEVTLCFFDVRNMVFVLLAVCFGLSRILYYFVIKDFQRIVIFRTFPIFGMSVLSVTFFLLSRVHLNLEESVTTLFFAFSVCNTNYELQH
jgi:hypothetical protein